jgi:integrase
MAKMISMKLKNVETRDGWHHFRLNVPKDLQDRIGKKVIKKTLETQDDLVAQRAADRLTREWKTEFMAMRADNPERNKSVDERIDTMRQTMRPLLDADLAEATKLTDPDLEIILEDLQDEHDWLIQKQWKQVTVKGLYEDLRTATDKQDDPRMIRRVVRLYREMLNHYYVRLKEELDVAVDLPFRAPSWKSTRMPYEEGLTNGHQNTNKATLADCLEEILSDGKQRTEQTIKALKADVALFEEFLGKRPVQEFSITDIVSYRDDCLRMLPSNAHKKFEGKTLKELLAIPESEAKRPSLRTVANRLRNIRQVFIHAQKSGKILIDPCATVKDIKQQANKGGSKSRDEDKAFTTEQLKDILKASKAQNWKERPSRRWATQIMLHLGLRANEVLQLRASQIDVDVEGGALDFEVIDPKTQHLKTETSIRFLPIPSVMLKDEEFKAYVRERKSLKGDASLWADAVCASPGKWNKRWSYWFNKLDCVDTKRSAHGMRHAAVTRGRSKGIPLDQVQRVVGHEDGSGLTGNYTNKRDFRGALKDAVEAMAFTEE